MLSKCNINYSLVLATLLIQFAQVRQGRVLSHIGFSLCRKMTIHETDADFLSLAPDNLKSLSVRGDNQEAVGLLNIARLSALTHLEICQLNPLGSRDAHVPSTLDLEPLLHSPLVELIILDSRQMEGPLLTPYSHVCTFSRLQRLHIEERVFGKRFVSEEWQQKEQLRLKGLRDAIFNLPNLQQVSGASSIFTAAQERELQRWQRLETIEPPMTSVYCVRPDRLSYWRKP